MFLISNPISKADIDRIVAALGNQAVEDISWSENVRSPETPEAFAMEAIWIICNSGMKHTVARIIERRVLKAIEAGTPVSEVFRHSGKAGAMQKIWDERKNFFEKFQRAADKLDYLASLPWIGSITKYHLAKNCGVDCAKPDIHLQRLAVREGTDPHELCARLSVATGYRIATIDLVLWRACASGLINSRALD